MDSPHKGPDRLQVEAAFHALLERLRSDPASSRSFLTGQPEDLRAELERMLADYRLLLDAFTGSTGSLKRGRRLGEYELLAEIGRGGMGSVWEAEHHGLQRRVALKLLHPHLSLSPRALERFRREALAGARLSHPGIVAIYETGEDEGSAYLAMELVPGGFTLADRIAQWRESPEKGKEHWREVAQLFQGIAEALSYAHQLGVVHRDLKPGNILIADGGRPRIADFGLARLQDELAISRTGEMTGTPYYMSPEQAAGRAADAGPKADVFALGATLYEALTQQRPFDAESAPLVLEKILREDPKDPRAIRKDVPRDLAAIALKALEKKPAARYTGAREMGEDLWRYLADESVLAQPPGVGERSARWVRRNPVWSSTFALVVVALLVFAWQFGQIVSEQTQTRNEQALTRRMLALTTKSVELLDPRGVERSNSDPIAAFQAEVESLLPKVSNRPGASVALLALLGRVLYINSRAGEADILERALGLAEGNPGVTQADIATLRYLCGTADVRAFRLEKARQVLSLALRDVLQHSKFDYPLPRDIQTQLILALARGNRWKEIEELGLAYGDPYMWMPKRWNSIKAERGESDPQALETGLALGRLYYDRLTVEGEGNRRASEIFGELEAPAALRYGPKDARTLEIRLLHLAALHRSQGVRVCTREQMSALMYEIEDALGSDHPLAALAAWRLAVLALDYGDHEAALPACLLAVDRTTRCFGAHHLDTYNARTDLGMAWSNLGYYWESEEVLRGVISDMEGDEQLGFPHDTTLIAMRALVITLGWSGQPEEAFRVAQQACVERLRLTGPQANETNFDVGAALAYASYSGRLEYFEALLPLYTGKWWPPGQEATEAEPLDFRSVWRLEAAFNLAVRSGRRELALQMGAESIGLEPQDTDHMREHLHYFAQFANLTWGGDYAESRLAEEALWGCPTCAATLGAIHQSRGEVEQARAYLLMAVPRISSCWFEFERIEQMLVALDNAPAASTTPNRSSPPPRTSQGK